MDETVSERHSGRAEVPAVRGWLLVLILWLGIVSPLLLVMLDWIVIYQREATSPNATVLLDSIHWTRFTWTVTAIRIALLIAGGASLYVWRAPASVLSAIAAIWLAGPLLIFLSPLILTLSTGMSSSLVLPGLGFYWSACWAALLTTYLLRSRRVKAVYGFGRASTAQGEAAC